MHGGELASDGGGKSIVVLDVVRACIARGIVRGEFVQRPGELAQRPGPGIALVAHEALRHGQRVPLALFVDPHDFAQ